MRADTVNGTGDIESDKSHIDNFKIDSQTEKIDQSPVLGLPRHPLGQVGWYRWGVLISLEHFIISS